MAMKPEKAKKAAGKTNADAEKKPLKKPAPKPEKDDDDDLDDELPEVDEIDEGPKLKAGAKKKDTGDDDEDVDDGPDDWEKPEEEENWDPDFEEFDVPQSRGKKAGAKKTGDYEEEEFKVDDEFKDLFNDKDFDDDEDDDY